MGKKINHPVSIKSTDKKFGVWNKHRVVSMPRGGIRL